LTIGALLVAVALLASPAGAGVDTAGVWVPQGPQPINNGQVEGPTITNGAVVGAIQAVAPHPTNASILYVGGVHGGIWRTSNAAAANPTWTPQIDTATDLAIGDLAFDPTDATGNTLVAGVGYQSSFGQGTTALGGVWRTTNGGTTWTLLGDANIQGENVIAVQARGAVLLAGSNRRGQRTDGVFATLGVGRLMRSIDTGATWTVISGGVGTGLPGGAIYDIVGDPGTAARFYCTVAGVGVYRSDDMGATWNNLTSGSAAINAAMTNANMNNAELAVAPTTGRLYAAVMINGQLNYIGYTDNPTVAAPTWTAMDTPLVTDIDGSTDGIQPRAKPGSQGGTHFSIVADPTTATTVYVGGDRQDGNAVPPAPSRWPNVIGAQDFSANHWRGDTTVAPTGLVFSPQWDHLGHSNAVVQIPGGGTASGSAPHADSRGMAFDANGNLVEVDDGGVFRRTQPASNLGDWSALHGNLQLTEAHDIAYDTVSNIIMIGDQDTGTAQQTATGSTVWTSVATADGAEVRVDPTLPAGGSTRYSSIQSMGSFRRQTYNGAGGFIAQVFPVLAGPPLPAVQFAPQFKTPYAINAVTSTRMVFGGSNGVFESTDQGATIAAVPGGGGVNRPDGLAYGGTSGAVPNPDVLYVGSGNSVLIRTTAGGNLVASAAYAGGYVRDIVLDPDDWMTAFVVTQTQVWQTIDAGATWTDVTGDLAAAGAVDVKCIEYLRNGANDAIAVGTRTGVYTTTEATLGSWDKLGTGMPNARVWDMQFDEADNVLVAATMGRGVWMMSNVTIVDVLPPVITSNVARTLLWPARRGMMPIGFSASAVDAIDPNPVVTVEVFSDEANGAAPFAPDATGMSPATTFLRAERAYPGDGRVYLIVTKATDNCGNVAVDCKTVTVPVMPVGFWILNARMQAMTAQTFCQANAGAAPAGFVLLHSYTVP